MAGIVRSLLYMLYGAVPFTSEITARSIFGDRYITPKRDDIGRALFKRGVHEPHVSRWVREHLDPGPGELIIDVGANLGYYAVLFAQLGTRRHTVLAFEPEPYNYQLLTRNVELNGAGNVRAFRLALGETSEQRDLVMYKASNRGRHSLLDLHAGSRTSVDVRSLDGVLEEHGLSRAAIRLLKLDVEGYEFFVLKGAEAAVRRCQYIVLEYSPQYFRRSGLGAGFFETFLDRHGLRCHTFTERGLSELPVARLAETTSQIDLLLCRET